MAEDGAIIIGGGLGGLECGFILSKHGMKVTVLEASPTPGGCLQTFRRKGCTFDTGFHYVGGLGEGESLRPFFDYFGLMDLPWKRLDPDAFEEIVFPDGSYTFANGFEAFGERLCGYFPHEKEGISRMTGCFRDVLSRVGEKLRDDSDAPALDSLFGTGAYDFLCSATSDKRLRDVLSGSSLKMELSETLPLFVFAEINASFIQSSWRLDGGGALIASSLAESIRRNGGEVRTGCPVVSVIEEDGAACGVVTALGETLRCGTVISDIHPAKLLSLIPASSRVHRPYRDRISSLKNSRGMFTANIILKEGCVPYLNRNIFVHADGADLWHPDPASTSSVMISHYPSDSGFSTHLDLLSPMDWSLVEDWKDSGRGEGYAGIKEKKLRECLDLASAAIPNLRESIDSVYTSSPLTWSDGTGTPCGSAYGICKDWRNPMTTLLSTRTPIRNLYMTGQNLFLHGILGTTITSCITCSGLIGKQTLRSEIFGI